MSAPGSIDPPGGGPSGVPVLAIDGPTASGKGSVAARVAAALGFHYLDSGALYRLVALQSLAEGVDLDDGARLAGLAARLQPGFRDGRIELSGRDVTAAIRNEEVSRGASRVAVHPGVRRALVGLQQGFRRPPGLVADGRDMGTVIFPDARLKVFLTANVGTRAERRHKQLMDNGISANLPTLLQDLQERDARDLQRAAAPLAPATDARLLDSSALGIDEVVAQILSWWRAA